MSLIYSKLTSFINSVNDKFHESFLFTVLFYILAFIENEWADSFFKKLYPNENFLSFLKKSYILKNHIFNPLIILLVLAAFLYLSLDRISLSLTETLIIAFVFFIIGSVVLPHFFLNENVDLVLFRRKDISSIGFCLILISIAFFFICVVSVGGIPILKPSLRYLLKPSLTMPVFLIIPGTCIMASVYLKDFQEKIITRSQVRFRFLVLLMVNVVFLLALGYRTPLLAALLILIIMGYYGNIIAVWEVVVSSLIGIIVIIGIGYYRSLNEYTISSAIDPFYTLRSRADFTLHVLNLLDGLGGNFGVTHGQILINSIPGSEVGPRMMVGRLISWRTEVTVTPTLIGQMVADFGKVGVAVEMCILGFILGIGFKIVRKTKDYFYIGLYSLILTYSILGVETGILDIQVLFYFIVAIFIYLIVILKTTLNK